MSNWKPRKEHAQTLSVEQLRDFYVSADPRIKKQTGSSYAPKKRQAAAYTRPTISGRGAYKTNGNSKNNKAYYAKVPNAPSGSSFSSDYGSRLGSVLGEGLQSFANVFGFGEYDIKQNSLMSQKYIDTGTSPPRVRNTNKGEATVFSHREYVGELVTGNGTPTDFSIQTFPINPGNSLLFPLCAGIARHFQEWEVRGMLVELKSEASNTATSLSLGSMFCAVDYNALDAPPTSKVELENLEYACSNKPTDSILMPIECARSNSVMTHMYVINDLQYQGGDKRFVDLGNLFVGSYGCPQADVPIAEIWITYEIAFFKPHLPQHVPPAITYGSGVHYWGNTTTLSYPFQNIMGFSPNNSGDITFSANSMYFPTNVVVDRFYIVELSWRCQGSIPSPAGPNVSFQNLGLSIVQNTFSGIAANHEQTYCGASSANSLTMSYQIKLASGSYVDIPRMNFSGGSTNAPGSTSYWDIMVTECPKNGLL